jgi:hypothetical protein
MIRAMTTMLPLTLLGLLFGGCPEGGVIVGDDDTADDDTADDDDDDDTGDDDSGDDDTEPVTVTDLQWWLHDEMGSLVHTSWNQDVAADVHVEYSFDPKEWHSSPTQAGAQGGNEQLVVGIPFGTDAEWRVVVAGHDPVDGDPITTAPTPVGLPLAAVEISDPDAWIPWGNYLLTSINEDNGGWTGGTYWTFIVDRNARPVWASAAPSHNWTLFSQVAVSGDHILWDEATYWSDWDGGEGSKVHRTYLDAEIDVIPTPGLHHAFVQLPDGTLVWGSQYHGGGEALVEKMPGDPDETVIWTCQNDWPGVGDCESNGIFYQEATDSFLYSFYTNSSIVEVDHVTGESLWWAGEVGGGYDFSPSNSQFSWQHGISYTDDDTLLVSTESAQWSTMLREYQMNHNNQTLELVWGYDPGVHAGTNGDAWRLDNGNSLHVVGDGSVIYEVTENSTEVWRLDFNGSRLLGRGEFIEDLYTLVSP